MTGRSILALNRALKETKSYTKSHCQSKKGEPDVYITAETDNFEHFHVIFANYEGIVKVEDSLVPFFVI